MKLYLINKFKNYWKSFVWSLLICLLLFIPGNKFPKQEIFHIPELDKVVHLILFLILEWLLLLDVSVNKIVDNLAYIIKINSLTIIFALLTELIQRYLILERSGNINDFCFDIIGLVIGIMTFEFFYRFIVRFFPRKF